MIDVFYFIVFAMSMLAFVVFSIIIILLFGNKLFNYLRDKS